MQRSGAEAIRTQFQPIKPKREITKITSSQTTKRTYDQQSEQLFPKMWPLSNPNRTKDNILSTKRNAMFLFAILGVKNIDFKKCFNSVVLPSNKGLDCIVSS